MDAAGKRQVILSGGVTVNTQDQGYQFCRRQEITVPALTVRGWRAKTK